MGFWDSDVPTWISAGGTVGSAVGTIWAVWVAVAQSNKASEEAVKIRKESVKPIVYPTSMNVSFIPGDERMLFDRVHIDLDNYGFGVATNVEVVFNIKEHQFRTSMFTYKANGMLTTSVPVDDVLIPANSGEKLIADLHENPISAPCLGTGEIRYRSLLGDTYSRSFSLEVKEEPLMMGNNCLIHSISSEVIT